MTCCSGRRQISKTSCSISGPTLTTIARIPHWKGERRIQPCHDQSQISARLDGSPIVDPYFRPQWLPNFSNIRAHCGIRSGLQKPGMKSCGVCALGCSAFRGPDRFAVTKSVQKGRGISLSRRDLPVISALVAIRQTQAVTAFQRQHNPDSLHQGRARSDGERNGASRTTIQRARLWRPGSSVSDWDKSGIKEPRNHSPKPKSGFP